MFRTLFDGLSGYLGLYSSVPGPRKDTGSIKLGRIRGEYFSYPDQIQEALRWAGLASGAGRELHLCPHLLTKKRRLKPNTAPVKALWADADEARLPEGFPEPTIEVSSSPGNRHLYWALAAELDPAEAEKLNKDLTHTIGADSGGRSLACMMRLPGTLNRKHNPPAGIRIISHDASLRYRPREISQYLEEAPGFQTTSLDDIPDLRDSADGRELSLDELDQLSRKMRNLIVLGNKAAGRPYKSRSHADFAVVIAMLGAGFGEEAIWGVFRDPSNGISEKYFAREEYGNYYLARTIREARKKVEPAYTRRRGPGRCRSRPGAA